MITETGALLKKVENFFKCGQNTYSHLTNEILLFVKYVC